MSADVLTARHISHGYGGAAVLDDVSLTVAPGEFLAIVGSSGCGKSTLLNILAGHMQPARGSAERTCRTRMVHQRDGVFPWMTVSENIAVAVEHIDDPRQQFSRIRSVLELVRLTHVADEYPHRLSIGMRQRVELARAIASDSEMLLLDEPFSSLDYLSRLRLGCELIGWLAGLMRTVVLVTHDLDQAAQLADRIVILGGRPAKIAGQIVLHGAAPRDPTDPQVVSAVGQMLRGLDIDPRGLATNHAGQEAMS